MTPPPCSSKERRLWIILVVAAYTLRLIHLGHRAMSHDESLHAIYSWYLSNGLNYHHDPMMHGPLLFHLNALIYTLFPVNDFTSLLFPAFWGTACVGILFLYRRWLGIAGALCAAVFIAIEPALSFYSRYLRNDIMVAFFTLLMVWAILDYRETQKSRSLLWLAIGLALQFITKETCFIVGAVLGSACVFFALFDRHDGSEKNGLILLLRHPLIHCALLMLFLALPFAGALLLPLFDWDPLDTHTRLGQNRIFGVAGVIYLLCTSLGATYFFTQKKLNTFGLALGLFWGIQLLFYSTLLTNIHQGMASGLAGSLGYWLAQHDVQRGNPDPFFYLTLLLLYTPVLLLTALLSARHLRRWPMPFLWWWSIGSFLIYSWAGERMPWLVLHITLPLCLIAGTQLPALLASPGRKFLKTILVLGCFQLICNSLRLNGPHSEGATEPMVFAHSGPHIKTSLLLITEQLQKHPDNVVSLDNAFTWPMAWYFRETATSYTENLTPDLVLENSTIALIKPSEEIAFQDAGWTSRMSVDMINWPRPDYHKIDLENIDGVMRIPSVRKKFFKYYLFRDQPEWGVNEWPAPNRYILMTR
ncbi:TIGR03663 family protein [Kiritimatiellota bacterium B12222]|nr:TIGR03663 family protein [Kiritimatiellota bacterium B12222]